MSHSPIPRFHSICDFCDARPIAKIYDAAPVATVFAGERILFPDTKWSACASCATLIDQGQWGDLTDRCAKIWLKEMRARGVEIGYSAQTSLRQDLERMHAFFREAMGRTA
jgi:hypothetical protein